jgi:hypothetical protein
MMEIVAMTNSTVDTVRAQPFPARLPRAIQSQSPAPIRLVTAPAYMNFTAVATGAGTDGAPVAVRCDGRSLSG